MRRNGVASERDMIGDCCKSIEPRTRLSGTRVAFACDVRFSRPVTIVLSCFFDITNLNVA
jgi:hypothetical protein